jgi:DNA transposition AAA+ family ATPase
LAYKSGNITMKALGIQYGISRSCIGKVINGKASYIASVNEAIAADVVAALTRH